MASETRNEQGRKPTRLDAIFHAAGRIARQNDDSCCAFSVRGCQMESRIPGLSFREADDLRIEYAGFFGFRADDFVSFDDLDNEQKQTARVLMLLTFAKANA